MELSENLLKYSKKQIDFMFAMLETGNVLKSSKMAGITETTAFRYLKNGLSEEINNIRKERIEENLKRLEFASIKATNTIIDILNDNNCPKSVILNASKTIIDYTLKTREQNEIIERLNNIARGLNNDK